jgi:hypothetical protein
MNRITVDGKGQVEQIKNNFSRKTDHFTLQAGRKLGSQLYRHKSGFKPHLLLRRQK